MPVIFQSHISRADLELNPHIMYVFGDNHQRRGRGGLAKECRDMSNAVGVRTKKAPTDDESAFLTDDELAENKDNIFVDLTPVYSHLDRGGIVVFPVARLGSGLAELEARAPETWEYLQASVDALSEEFPPIAS